MANVTEPPEQNASGPDAVTVGVAGTDGAVNETGKIVDGHPELVKVILYAPTPNPVIVVGKVAPIILPLAAPVHDKSPVPDPVTTIDPSFIEQDVGFVCVPKVIAGIGLTVTVVPKLEVD